jgi:hypothetical protein
MLIFLFNKFLGTATSELWIQWNREYNILLNTNKVVSFLYNRFFFIIHCTTD